MSILFWCPRNCLLRNASPIVDRSFHKTCLKHIQLLHVCTVVCMAVYTTYVHSKHRLAFVMKLQCPEVPQSFKTHCIQQSKDHFLKSSELAYEIKCSKTAV